MLQPFISPRIFQIYPVRIFSFLQVEKEFKKLHFADVAEIQKVVSDELKKVQKEEFSVAFRNCTTAQEHIYIYIYEVCQFSLF